MSQFCICTRDTKFSITGTDTEKLILFVNNSIPVRFATCDVLQINP